MNNADLNSIILSTLAAKEPIDLTDLEDDIVAALGDDDHRWFDSRFRRRLIDRTSSLLTQTKHENAVMCFIMTKEHGDDAVVIR